MRVLLRLLPYFRPYLRSFFLGTFSIVAAVIFGLFGPMIMGLAVDSFKENPSSSTLLLYAGALVGATAIRGLFNFAQRNILVSLSRQIERDLRGDYFRHLQTLEHAWYQNRTIGDLMARGTNDLQAVRMLCGPAIMYSINTVLTALGCLIFMFSIHGTLSLLALATMPLVVLSTQYFGAKIHHHFKRVQDQFSTLTANVQENISGLRVIRAYAREPWEKEQFAVLNDEYVERNQKLIRWDSAFRPILNLLVGVGFGAVLWYGGIQTLEGEMSIGDFVAFNFFLHRLVWPMIAVGWVINLVQRGSASMGRLAEIMDTEPTIVDGEADHRITKGALEFRDLTFAYEEGSPVLRGIRVSIETGTTVALVGRTGAGKSTLLSLLPRLFDPPAGSLFIDGMDVRGIPLAELRRSIAMVKQESFLFSANLSENIAFGHPEASEETIQNAATWAGLDSDLAGFPLGLETRVGERGITLSGGQKQRVALARALLRDSPILLLDDCFSAVDTATEEKILGHLNEVFPGHTVMIISHRISTVRHADLILVLHEGKIIERGNHGELMAIGGLYADLEERQRLEEELAAI